MADGILNELITRLGVMSPKDKSSLLTLVAPVLQRKWIPNPGPQTEAYFSEADILLYGGSGGSGKTGLITGLALTAHERTLIMRRQYGDLSGIIDDMLRIYGTRDGFSASPRIKLQTDDGRTIDFGAAQYLGDEQKWQGNPHDLICFDEVVHFLEEQVRFIIGWNRSVKPGQRCRVVMASNPPVGSQGRWIIKFFAPWLDPTHPNPAKAGELRWFVTDEDGKDLEVPGPEPVEIDGIICTPQSRTFIPGKLSDNPFLADTGYQAVLDSMPEPMRSAIRDGNFMVTKDDAPDQLIPTSWVMEAVKRWTPKPPANIPMCGIGVDPAGGGADETIIAVRHDTWFAPTISMKGSETPDGQNIGGKVISIRRDRATVTIDTGGGYGNLPLKELQDNEIDVRPFKGGATSTARSNNKLFGFVNKRAEAWYRFRELLDPNQPGGSPAMLPNEPQLIADLTTPTFKETVRGIQIEAKEDIRARLGRSPDRGDAVVMAWHGGSRMATDGVRWLEKPDRSGRIPTVNLGYSDVKRSRRNK